MPRNREKNVYITIGLPRNSPVLRQLEEESQRSGTSLAKLIPVKLSELYSSLSGTLTANTPSKPKPKSAETNALAFLDSEDE